MKSFIVSIALIAMPVAIMAKPVAQAGECMTWKTRDGSVLVDRQGNAVQSRFDSAGNSNCQIRQSK